MKRKLCLLQHDMEKFLFYASMIFQACPGLAMALALS